MMIRKLRLPEVWKVPKLRDYEQRAVDHTLVRLPLAKRMVLVGPTGCGKTVIGAAVVDRLAPMRTLWLAHRRELIEQGVQALKEAGVPHSDLGVLSGTKRSNENARVLVASVDMFHGSSLKRLPEFDLAFVDEAHRVLADSYLRILAERPEAWVVGLTATPWRLDGQGLGDVFRELYTIAEYAELCSAAQDHSPWLALPIVYSLSDEEARKIVKGLSVIGGDYAPAATGRRMMSRVLMGQLVNDWLKYGKGKPSIVFAATREHGWTLWKRLNRVGDFEYLDGDTSADEREAMLVKLATKELDGIVNVDVLTEGFDCSVVKCIVLARPTRSLTRYRQQVGRGSRFVHGQEFVVLDEAGNHLRFGLPDERIEWSLENRSRLKRGQGSEVNRSCVNLECRRAINVGLSHCPHCGFEQPKPERQMVELGLELKRIEAQENERQRRLKVIAELGKKRGWTPEQMRALERSVLG